MRPGPCRAGILGRIPPEWLYIRCRESGVVPHPPVEAAPAHPDLPAHVPRGKTLLQNQSHCPQPFLLRSLSFRLRPVGLRRDKSKDRQPQPLSILRSALTSYRSALTPYRFPLCASRFALSVTTP